MKEDCKTNTERVTQSFFENPSDEEIEDIAVAIKDKKHGVMIPQQIGVIIAENLKAFSCSPKAQKNIAEAIRYGKFSGDTAHGPPNISEEVAIKIAENLGIFTDKEAQENIAIAINGAFGIRIPTNVVDQILCKLNSIEDPICKLSIACKIANNSAQVHSEVEDIISTAETVLTDKLKSNPEEQEKIASWINDGNFGSPIPETMALAIIKILSLFTNLQNLEKIALKISQGGFGIANSPMPMLITVQLALAKNLSEFNKTPRAQQYIVKAIDSNHLGGGGSSIDLMSAPVKIELAKSLKTFTDPAATEAILEMSKNGKICTSFYNNNSNLLLKFLQKNPNLFDIPGTITPRWYDSPKNSIAFRRGTMPENVHILPVTQAYWPTATFAFHHPVKEHCCVQNPILQEQIHIFNHSEESFLAGSKHDFGTNKVTWLPENILAAYQQHVLAQPKNYPEDNRLLDYVILYSIALVQCELGSKEESNQFITIFRGNQTFEAVKDSVKTIIETDPNCLLKQKIDEMKSLLRTKKSFDEKQAKIQRRFNQELHGSSKYQFIDMLTSELGTSEKIETRLEAMTNKEMIDYIEKFKLPDTAHTIQKIQNMDDQKFDDYKSNMLDERKKALSQEKYMANNLRINELLFRDPKPIGSALQFDSMECLTILDETKLFFLPPHVFGAKEVPEEDFQEIKKLWAASMNKDDYEGINPLVHFLVERPELAVHAVVGISSTLPEERLIYPFIEVILNQIMSYDDLTTRDKERVLNYVQCQCIRLIKSTVFSMLSDLIKDLSYKHGLDYYKKVMGRFYKSAANENRLNDESYAKFIKNIFAQSHFSEKRLKLSNPVDWTGQQGAKEKLESPIYIATLDLTDEDRHKIANVESVIWPNIFEKINKTTASQPYQKDITRQIELDEVIVYRPNHNGTHSARQAYYVKKLVDLVGLEVTTEEKAMLRLAAYCYRLGRVDESSGGQDDNRLRSAQVFKEYADQTLSQPMTDLGFKLISRNYETQLEDTREEKLYKILDTAHRMDLPRCFNDGYMQKEITKINANLEELEVQRTNSNALINFAIRCIDKTGGRVKYKGINKYDPNYYTFSENATDCWNALQEIQLELT